MEPILVNKVAESGIITLSLEPFLPQEEDIAEFDIKPFLFRELILKEKDFRAALKEHSWEAYRGKNVAVNCSADAIIPMWAYMLIAVHLEPVASSVFFGSREGMVASLLEKRIEALDIAGYSEQRVVVKGCGDKAIPEAAFLAIAAKLKPVVKSLMYGEPCSTVPVYKKK